MRTSHTNIAQRRLRVGVTLYIRDDGQSLWENGIFQNCYFLLMLLNKSEIVDSCFVVNGGPAEPSGHSDLVSSAPAPIISLSDALENLDVIIELSAQLDPAWAALFRERGGRIVGMRVANDHVIDAERMIFNLPHALLMSGTKYDVIWTLPAFMATCASYYELGFRAPVRNMPHLWNAHFVDKAITQRGLTQGFQYQPGKKLWRVAILEPNICSVKTCHLPMLVCDLAHRNNSNFLANMRIYNGMKIKEHSSFIGFARSLELVKQGLATFEPRIPIFDLLPFHADVIVSHHWNNAQNYLYYEALYGGFPLVHNSDLIGGCGYYYDTFNCEDGALALQQAYLEHDSNLEEYRTKSKIFLDKLDPLNDINVFSYSHELLALF